MAKGLRAKSKVQARNARRFNPKGDYAVEAAARLQRVATRLARRNKGPDDEEDDEEVEGVEVDADGKEAQMEVEEQADGGAPSKISTSGTRESRRETWRKAKGWKERKGSKNGGKVKRRR